MAKKKEVTKLYKATLQIGSETFEASAGDATEAILNLKPDRIMSRAVFTLEHDGKTSSFMKTVGRARMVFHSRLNATILARNLKLRLR